MEYLQTQEIDGRGDHIFWVSLDDQKERLEILAVIWSDKNGHYFFGNDEGVAEVELMWKTRWHQVNKEPNIDLDQVHSSLTFKNTTC